MNDSNMPKFDEFYLNYKQQTVHVHVSNRHELHDVAVVVAADAIVTTDIWFFWGE